MRSEPRSLAEAAIDGTINLAGLAHRAVTEMIRDRRLRGGDTVVETRLAETLGLSRTPLREALQRLEGEGLLHKRANQSFVVRQVDLAEYLHSLRVRELLEPEAAVLGAGGIRADRLHAIRHAVLELRDPSRIHTDAHWRSDDEVHGAYLEACGNPVLARTVDLLRNTTRLFEIARLSDRVAADAREHLVIVEALIAADPRAIRRAVGAHLRSLRRFTLATAA